MDADWARQNAERQIQLEALAYRLWEEQGWPAGRHEEYWAEAERRLRPKAASTPTTPAGLMEVNVIDGSRTRPGAPRRRAVGSRRSHRSRFNPVRPNSMPNRNHQSAIGAINWSPTR